MELDEVTLRLVSIRWTRRHAVRAGAVALAGALLPLRGLADPASDTALTKALAKSPLIYLSPLKKDGSESRCHGEVWFAAKGDALFVVTTHDRWRARAIRQGLGKARIWVGDHGVWTSSDGAYESDPNFVAKGEISVDKAEVAKALELFGLKYSKEWGKWGPRFEKGLSDGSRVLLRYERQG